MSLIVSSQTVTASLYVSLSSTAQTPSGALPTAEDSDSAGFGAAVSVATTVQSADAGQRAQEGTEALATLKQAQQTTRDANKNDAAAKLAEAIKELALLKILGTGIEGAREAAKLAKQIAAAVKEYAGASAGTDGDAPTGDLSGLADTLSQAAAAINGQTAATLPTATGSGSSDPFYSLADAALAVLKKYLAKVLPALQNSPDPKIRAEARRLGREFQAALTTTSATESNAAADSTTGAAASPTLSTASSAPTVDLVA